MNSGFNVKDSLLGNDLFDFQVAITKWALMRGRAAIFADTGLGKTPMQLIWAKNVHKKTGRPVLIFAPLAVSKQTQSEGNKFNVNVNICESQNNIKNGINITNYEKLHKFKPDELYGIVIDESSILKGFDGKFRKTITDFAQAIPYRLACTATPAPNDLMEIINHAEFLGIMKQKEITGLFFIQDGNVSHKWRLKNHAKNDFYRWLASWAIALQKPSDLGFNDNGFILPKLYVNQIIVKTNSNSVKGQLSLMPIEVSSLSERQVARKQTIEKRVKETVRLVSSLNEQWLIWCGLNAESKLLAEMIPDSVEVKGSDKSKHKEDSMINFQRNKIRILITKPSIAGFGMNWQNCHNIVFVGLSDSFEMLYQATRRCWRFGQKKEVNSYIITSDVEGSVIKNIERKEKQVKEMMKMIIKNMNIHGQVQAKRNEMIYNSSQVMKLPLFTGKNIGKYEN